MISSTPFHCWMSPGSATQSSVMRPPACCARRVAKRIATLLSGVLSTTTRNLRWWSGALTKIDRYLPTASSLSASQSLISDWRVTPRLRASRSSCSTIQFGKSTLTRLASRPGRRAFFQSTRCRISSFPSSKILSNSLAFITRYLRISRAPYRNDSDDIGAIGDHGDPVLFVDRAYHQKSGFVRRHHRQLKPVVVRPKGLRFFKIDPVLGLVRLALDSIELEAHCQS